MTGLLQHVIVRGSERRVIFNDDHDRQLFVDRLFSVLRDRRSLLRMGAFIQSFPFEGRAGEDEGDHRRDRRIDNSDPAVSG